jgi:pimeloyl-ACP methyl ester carboxylesterase
MNQSRYFDVEARLWDSLGLDPTERYVRLPRLDSPVRVQQVGDGPVVLFVHGGSASGANWAPLLPFVRGVRCVLLDRPGCGGSPKGRVDIGTVDRFNDYADTLVADVLDALEIATAHVVATSLGGCFALRGAAAHGDRVERLTLFGYVVGAPLSHVPASMRVATLPVVGRLISSIPPTRSAVRMILRQLGLGPALANGRITEESFDWFHSLLRDTPTLHNEARLPRDLLRPAATSVALPSELLERVRCPVAMAWGECDPFGGAEVAERFVRHLPDATLEMWPDAGHAPWIDDPERAAARIAGDVQVRR